VLLSATLPNLPQLGEWLKKLNSKETKIIVSNWRPQPLDWHLETYPEQIGYGSYFKNKAAMFQTALATIQEHPEDIWLVFCHSKTDGRAIKEMIEDAGIGGEIEFHSADSDKDERIKIEDDFKARKHKILIATSTLAYGSVKRGTQISLLNLKKNVEKLKIGDDILSYNEETKQIEQDSVLSKEIYYSKEEYVFELADGKTLTTDWKHPFYVRTKNGIIQKKAKDLKETDDIILQEELYSRVRPQKEN
jgi:hypothetical protein